MLNRRSALRQIFCVSAGALILPSCMNDKSKPSVVLKKIEIDGEDEKLLAELAETIIPKTSTPGAKDIYAHVFAFRMIDDCYKQEDQQKFVKGMKQFRERTKTELKKSFVEASPADRASFLKKIEADKQSKDELNYFYSTTKRLVIQAYTTSEFYLTKVQVYEMVPSRYHGCVPVKALNTKPA